METAQSRAIKEKFHSVIQSEGFSLLLAMVKGRRMSALRKLETCGSVDLALAQAEFRAWDEVLSCLGSEDGGGDILEFLETLKEKPQPKRSAPPLRVPGNQ